MPDLFDRLENRTAAARESALFRDFRHVFAIAKPRVPALRSQLRGVEIGKISSRADLAQIPIVRRGELLDLQKQSPPFGGVNATRLSALRHAFVGPDQLLSLEGQARDWWGVGRALYAAGLRKGQLVFNCFAYDMVPDGHMIEAGVASILAPVVPAGGADIEVKLDAIRRLQPQFFCGRADEFRRILNLAMDRGIETACFQGGLVTGRTRMGHRSEYTMRKFALRHALILPETGLIAFETDDTDRMILNEGLIVEIIDPATKQPVARGERGEIVVTRLNPDFPLLRYATGILSSICDSPSGCGRTNLRITAPHESTPDFVETDGRRIAVSHLREIATHHPGVERLSLIVRKIRERDGRLLRVEHAKAADASLAGDIEATFQKVTALGGTVELLPPGSLSDEDAPIIDERPLN